MTKEQCCQTLLKLIVRAHVDGHLPAMTMVCKLHTFLTQLDAMESCDPVFALEALGDWVPRLLQGIADSTLVTIHHPPVMLQASTEQSTIYMDLVVDAMAINQSSNPQQTALAPEPRFTLCEVIGHKIVAGKLAYWVRWEGNSFFEEEVYQNIHHLDIFKDYERSIVPLHWAILSVNRCKSSKQKAALVSYAHYLQLRDEAASLLTEEFDTEDEGEGNQVSAVQQGMHNSSPLEHVASDDSISWGDLLVAEDDGHFMPSNLDLGGSFGTAGPSIQGDLFSWMD
jgi:hypothetical protein